MNVLKENKFCWNTIPLRWITLQGGGGFGVKKRKKSSPPQKKKEITHTKDLHWLRFSLEWRSVFWRNEMQTYQNTSPGFCLFLGLLKVYWWYIDKRKDQQYVSYHLTRAMVPWFLHSNHGCIIMIFLARYTVNTYSLEARIQGHIEWWPLAKCSLREGGMPPDPV